MDQNDGDSPISNTDVNNQAQLLYNKSVQLDRELKGLLKKKSLFDKSVVAIRHSLKETYEKLLLLNFDFAASQDIEHSLWKTVFYKLIEEYRKRIRQSINLLSKADSGSSATKEKEDLHKLCESFRTLLHSASKFYKELIKKFQKTFNLKLDGTEYDGVNPVHKSYLSCHRCTIFLGDLARYHRDLHNHSSQKDWTTASTYYRQALKLIPDNGNPHNQLAVLATYVDDEFVAVYHYFLSLACTHPFTTAKDNLLVLFDKNRSRLEGIVDNSQESQKHITELRKLLSKFVRLHGILYTKTSLEKFDELENDSLRRFDKLMSKGQLNDDILFMMFVINMFSIHNISQSSNTVSESTNTDASQKALLFKYAFSLGLHFFARTLKFSCQSQEPRHIISIGVYVEFLKNMEQLKKPDERDLPTWSFIWKEYAKLLTLIGPIDSKLPVSAMPTIREEVELRGFSPLLNVYRRLPYPLSDPSEDQTRIKRLAKIKEFGAYAIQELPKTPLFYDAENQVWSDQPVQSRPVPEKRTISPISIPQNTSIIPKQITPRASLPVDSTNEEVPEEKFEKVGIDELLDDDVMDEVILYPGENSHRSGDDYDSHKAVGSERIERSNSSDKHGEPTSPRNLNPSFGLFPQNSPANSSFFSFNSLFHPNNQANSNGNSFFGDPYANTNGTTSPPSPSGNFPATPIQNTNYSFPQSPNFNNANPNLRNDPFGSFWSPGTSNSFFVPPQQGDKVNNHYNLPPNPFVQQNIPKAQNNTQQQPQTNIWINGSASEGQQPVNNFGNSNAQPTSPTFQFNPAPLPFPFPGGATAQQSRFKTKNPFIS